MKTIGIVILSYKNVSETIDCINSINMSKLEGYYIKIILVDNSGSDEYSKQIMEACLHIDNLILSDNNGYSAGNNLGIKKALEENYDFIVVINNDTIVDSYFLRPLIAFLEENKYAIVAPKILNYYTKKVWSSGGRFRRLLGDYCMLYDDITCDRETSFISGCCFATTRSVYKKIGLLDETYFMYCEDTDFCLRALNQGVSLTILKDSIIYHKVGVTSGVNSPFQLYYIYRNRIYFCYQHFSGIYKFYAVAINIIRAYFQSINYKIKHKSDLSKALIFAIKDSKKSDIRRY